MTRVCFSCKENKVLSADNFYRDPNRQPDFQRECKLCVKARRAKWWKSPQGKRSAKNTKLKARFGITVEHYERMLEIADNACSICRQNPDGILNVDHDHRTGRIRGLLCSGCNLGIGNLKDSIKNLENAIVYLQNN